MKDMTILITGANRGIGESLVRASLEKGAKKVYATCRDIGKMPNFEDDRVVVLELDITDNRQIGLAVEQASDTNVLINNAGTLSEGSMLNGEMGHIQRDMNVNCYGNLQMMRAFAPVLESSSPSRIVNITSIVAYSPLPSIAGYLASKAALLSATYSVRAELAKKGVTVHAVNPGAIDTDMNKGSDWDMPSPDDVAKIILAKIENGELEIIPENIGMEMYSAWKEDPKKLAEIFYNLYHEEK